MGIVTTTLEDVVNWSRTNAMWPMLFGLACCAIEMMAAQASQLRPEPLRHGTDARQPAPVGPDDRGRTGQPQDGARCCASLYDQMPDPKWVIAMGDCASCGGVFNNYAIVQGVDEIVPVDVYVAGCPPRPEALIHGIMTLHEKVKQEKLKTW